MTPIEECRALPENDWLGEQEGREYPRDRGGSFARYVHGDIYFHPEYGTQTIGDPFRLVWAQHGYEKGWLGYPLTGHNFYSNSGRRLQEFEHGWLTQISEGAPVYATWIDPELYGWPTETAVGLTGGHIIQRTTEGKMLRSPDGTVTRYELDELTPPEIAYRERPKHFPTYAQREEQWLHPALPEGWEPEPEFPDGLDYDPDEIPEYD